MSFAQGDWVTDGNVAGQVVDVRPNAETGETEYAISHVKVGKLDKNPLREGETHHAYGDPPQEREEDAREKVRLTASIAWISEQALASVKGISQSTNVSE